MRYKEGLPREQSALLPPSIDEYVPDDHPIRVIDAFAESVDVVALGFDKATPARTGCKAYAPQDLLKLYTYGYLNRITSTRVLEKECHRNLEVMWLMRQLAPDFKTIADFRKDNGTAIKQCCKQFILFCQQAGLVSGALIAIDGSTFKAAASKDKVLTRKQLKKQLAQLDQKIDHYLQQMDQTASPEVEMESAQVQVALKKLEQQKQDTQVQLASLEREGKNQRCSSEPDAKLMRSGRQGTVVGYNVQNAVDSQHQLIVHHELTQDGNDKNQLQPQSEAVKGLLNEDGLIVADAGYSNGEHAHQLQAQGVSIAVPAGRAVNSQGDFYQKSDFIYLENENAYRCPAGELLFYKTKNTEDKLYLYSKTGCSQCALQNQCTKADRRWVTRHFYEDSINKSHQAATPAVMKQRMATVEPPFATLKRMMNQGRFSCWGLSSASSEYSLGVLSYNLMKAINVLGVKALLRALA